MDMGPPITRTSHRSGQGVFSHRCLRKASAANTVITGLEGSAGIAGRASRSTFCPSLLCVPLPEVVPPAVDADDPERQHRMDTLRRPACASDLQAFLRHVAVGTLDLPRAAGPATLLVIRIRHSVSKPREVSDEPA